MIRVALTPALRTRDRLEMIRLADAGCAPVDIEHHMPGDPEEPATHDRAIERFGCLVRVQ